MAYRLYPYPAKEYIFEMITSLPDYNAVDITINLVSDTKNLYFKAFSKYDISDATIPTAKVLYYAGNELGMTAIGLEYVRIYNNTPYVLHVQCWEKGHHADMDDGDWEADVPAGQMHKFNLDNVKWLDLNSYALITAKEFPSNYVYGNVETAFWKKL